MSETNEAAAVTGKISPLLEDSTNVDPGVAAAVLAEVEQALAKANERLESIWGLAVQDGLGHLNAEAYVAWLRARLCEAREQGQMDTQILSELVAVLPQVAAFVEASRAKAAALAALKP